MTISIMGFGLGSLFDRLEMKWVIVDYRLGRQSEHYASFGE